jgi:NAD(P)-dependent dehydrogenase (short-subunit alcohol dehydrogenase family)
LVWGFEAQWNGKPDRDFIDEFGVKPELGWTKEQFEAIKAGITKTIPLGRWAYSEEIGKASVFLASDESSYVAGIELFVDGGAVEV